MEGINQISSNELQKFEKSVSIIRDKQKEELKGVSLELSKLETKTDTIQQDYNNEISQNQLNMGELQKSLLEKLQEIQQLQKNIESLKTM